jgi:hypothetical protein
VTTASRSIVRFLGVMLALLLLVGSQTLGTATKAYAAPAGATITGTIVNSVSGGGIPNVVVSDAGGSASTTTNAYGTYSLVIPAGDHVLSATLSGYVPVSSALLSGLTDGQTVSDINFTLEQYAWAGGQVTLDNTSTGIASVVVKFFDATGTDANPKFGTTTGADGTWQLAGIVPGSYKVQFDAGVAEDPSRRYPGARRR